MNNFNNQFHQNTINNQQPKSNKNLFIIMGVIVAIVIVVVVILVIPKDKEIKAKKENEEEKAVVNECTFDGELTHGATYINGQNTYTYTYLTEGYNQYTNYEKLIEEGWHVRLTDKSSTEAVTTKLCTTINKNPIISMHEIFSSSKATNIDLSSLNTSNVNNMTRMFYESEATNIDLSSFNTSEVTDMQSMFEGAQLKNIDLRHFDTSNVTLMNDMFSYCQVSVLDLSSFDMSSVYNISQMFARATTTTVYARTQDDANKLNNSFQKPDILKVVVK